MGQSNSTKESEGQAGLDKYAREDEGGRRRLSVITLAGEAQNPAERLPPNSQLEATRTLDGGTVVTIACMSCAGTYAPDAYKENQDDYFAYENFGRSNNGMMFCVMDGHGVAGRLASSFVKTNLSTNLAKSDRLETDPKGVLRQAFFAAHTDLQNSRVDCTCSGTTCVLAYILDGKIVVANAGDSRCVLAQRDGTGFKHKDLSEDHKPELPLEKSRIESSGGRVEPMKDIRAEPIGPARVWVGREMYPGLAMSRSIGDSIAQSVGVSCEPQFMEHTLDFSVDASIILGSDGIWEFIDSEEAVTIAMAAGSAKEAANLLCREALRRWGDEEEVCDDITAVVIRFE